MRVYERLVILASAAIVGISPAPPLLADQPAPEPPSAKCLAVMQPFSQIASLPVKNRQDRTIGRMDDLLIDLHSGTVLCVLMTPAGAADDVVIAVPAQSFSSTGQKRAVLNASKETLQSAARLPKGANDGAGISKVVSEAYEHFHQPTIWTGPSVPVDVIRAGKLIGYPVHSPTGEDLGTLKDFMVDLLTARVLYSVMSLDGPGLSRYATPPAALALDSGKARLLLNAGKAKITAIARKGGDLANQMADPPWAAATYELYSRHEAANALATADPTRENVREKVDAQGTASATAVEPSTAVAPPALPDAEIKKRILTAIIRDDLGNAYSYKQLKILTENGHVTLQGRTKNQKQKAELGKLAESVVGVGKVENQLECRK